MKTVLPLFLILLCLLPISQTVSVSDSMILDLDTTDFIEFSSQAASWTLSEAVCPTCDHTYTIPTTTCWPTATWKVIGGPNVLGPSGSSAKNQYIQKEYPPMEKFPTFAVLQYDLTIFADVALGSSTVISSNVDFQINGVKSGSGSNSIGQCNPNMVDSQGNTILTMNRYSVGRANFDLSSISESQNGKGVTIKFLNMLNYPSKQRSWGIRNIKLYMFRNASQYSATNFPCGYGFFWDNALGCTECHPFCKTCTGTTNNECTSCNYPNFKYTNTTCLDTCVIPFTPTLTSTLNTCKLICTTTAKPYYVDYSATCSATCNSPLVSNSDKLCSLPCGTDKYQYPDGSCHSDCDAPLQQGTTFSGLIKTCTSTCANYLYSDGSCKTDCPAPLLTKLTGGVKSCYNPCKGTGDFLYPDSSCADTCDSPLQTENGVDGQYCKSSCPSDYIYPDNSCVAKCESPLEVENVSGIQYCKNTCSDYLYPDHSCLAVCEAPLKIQNVAGIQYCEAPCPSDYIYPDNSCVAKCESPLEVENVGGIQYCKNTCSDYLYPDHSCLDVCEAPLEINNIAGIQYCKTSCSDYLYPDSSCLGKCEAPLVAYQVGGIQYCKTSCPDTNDHLYPDDSCLGKCESPLIIESVGGISYCKTSCSDYLYPDNSCLTKCESPMTIKNIAGIQYCKNPCNDYTYPDGSCLTKCESPLLAENTAGVKYCKSPCSNDYLYSDGSCDDTCPVPLSEKTELDIKYCYNPCKESGTYLDSNQECQATCPSPSTIKTESIAKFCVFPCENLDDYYFEETGTCQATCKSPNTAVDSPLPKICKTPESAPIIEEPKPTSPSKEDDPEPEEEDESVEKITKAQNKANTVLSAGVFAFTILNPLDSTLSLIGSFSKMLQYIKYMKIDYPEKVLLMLKEQNDGFQDFPNKMAPNMLNEFPQHQLPEKFELYSTPSSFFVNFWSTLFKLSVILFVTLVVLVIAQQRQKSSKPVDGALKILVECLKWNLFLTFFCSNIGDVVLFTALEIRTLHLNNTTAVISFLLCLIANAGSLYVIYKIFDITWDLKKLKKKVTALDGAQNKHPEPEPEKKWANCQTLFAPYQDRWYYQHIFLFIFLARVCLFSGMLGYLFEYPRLQASAFVAFGILMLVFLIVRRPIKDRVSLIMEITFELVLLPFNLCVLILAIMDAQGIEKLDHRNRLGDVMIYINLIAPFLAIAMTATKAFLICRDFYKEMKVQKSKKLNAKTIYPEVASLDATQEVLPNNTTRILPASSIIDKNLLGNSQKIDDLEEEPSPTPSPERSLISNNRIQRINVIVEKARQSRARFHSTLVFADNMGTSSPEVSPTRDSASHTRDSISQSSNSRTPPENARRRFFARLQQRGNSQINQNL